MANLSLSACKNGKHAVTSTTDDFNYFVDQFEDMRVLRYKLPYFETLSLQQKKFIYFLSEAALCGRDILWVQNFRYNLLLRKTIEAIIESFSGDKESVEYKAFLIYAKRVFFANGIHHHYSGDKFKPGFTETYFISLLKGTEQEKLQPGKGQTAYQLISLLSPIIFDKKLFARKVEQKAGSDMVAESATNFYEGVTQKEVEEFYKSKIITGETRPVSTGLNSKVVKTNGKLTEEVYKSGGKYGVALEKQEQTFLPSITLWTGRLKSLACFLTHRLQKHLMMHIYVMAC